MKNGWLVWRQIASWVPTLFAKNAKRMGQRVVVCSVGMALAAMAMAQAVSTTTVQGTVYLANGQPGAGTLAISWPAFTTAAGQSVAADSMTVNLGPDGFVSVNLAPNVGATPAGQYYTAVYYMSDGTTSTQYWVIPAAAQASLAQVQAQVMPAAQAVQAVSKAYVDQAIAGVSGGSGLSATGGTITGPLYLNGDPTQPLQASDKHYVDTQVATAVPLSGGTVTGPLTAKQLGSLYQVDQFAGADIGAKIQACVNAVSASYGGTCDARNFTGNLTMGSNLTISTSNTAILLPCATITTANQIVVTAGTRNVSLRGCALRGGTAASGSVGGTALAYTGSGAMVEVGDPTYAMNTPGFHLDNVVINTTGATSATAQGLVALRTQEMDLDSLYFLGNSNQTGMTLDGTGNYTGGTFLDNQFSGFGTAVNAIGHQATNPATTDWMNASTFVRLHIDCPISGGNPISGTYGINLQQGDGNTFTGGDVEGCSTALHLGPNAENNTIVGLRNENSTSQVVADAGSAYNSWMTGGTMFTGKLTDNGTRNSFLDTFHRSFNALNGDWYMSQQDATLTNHFRLGTGAGNERGLLNEIQTDYGYRWLYGFSDATGGQQLYQMQDLLNNVYRLQIQQWNSGQSSTNNQTALNAAGTGNVCFNCSTNSGTGGVTFASGGATPAAVGTVDKTGNAQFVGNLLVGGTTQSAGTLSLRNNADAEVDYYLWPGLTTSQKGSFTYKDWNGNSQWYLVKDASNNWALNSATGGLDSFKAYQNTNSGDTYIDASNPTGHIRLNFESGSGAETDIYSGSSTNLDAAFVAPNAIKFPGLAASSGDSCLQIDNSGYITNTGAPCGSGSGSGGANGTINSATSGQIAYYMGNGTSIGGMNAVPLTSGGTGATNASGALANLGGEQTIAVIAFGAVGDCTTGGPSSNCTDNTSAIQAAINAAYSSGGSVYLPVNPATANAATVYFVGSTLNPKGVSIYGPHGAGGLAGNVMIRGAAGKDVFATGDPSVGGYTTPRTTYVWQDFGIVVDDSVDASASFPHRRPGRVCSDVVATTGSAAITSASCEFVPGDVGQNITLSDGTHMLSTTIASVGQGTGFGSSTAALARTWSYPTHSGSILYVSIMGLPTTATVGNCGLAYDDTSNTTAGNGPDEAVFGNLSIRTTSGLAQNNSCGLFFQGVAGQPYADIFENMHIRTVWGFLAVESDTAGSGTNGALGDLNELRNVVFDTPYPWVSYDGGWTRWYGGQIAGAQFGPQVLEYNAVQETNAGWWTVDNVELEAQGQSSAGGGWRIEGLDHKISNSTLGGGAILTPTQWDAVNSKCLNCIDIGAVNITGKLNDIELIDGSDLATINDTGSGNLCSLGRLYNPLDGIEPAVLRSCSATDSRQTHAFAHSSDFVANGDELTPYNNQADLWIWPEDLLPIGAFFPVVADTSSETGSHLTIPANNEVAWNSINQSSIVVGPANSGANLPATKVHICARMKGETGSGSVDFWLQTGSTHIASISPALTTTYSTACFDTDLSTLSGQSLAFYLGTPIATDLAWISVHPWPNAENINGVVNATNFEVSGSPLSTANLADWTDNGAGNGSVPMWNAATSRWAPGTLPASVSSINGNSGAFTFAGAGVACTGTTCTVAGGLGNGTVQAGSEYSPAFYNQSGSSATVGGVTPFTGLGYWQANSPPAAATAAEIVSAIGATAVANATTATTAMTATAATNFTGNLGGDVSGAQSATTVAKVNGASIPVSSAANCTNASSQIVACATTGSGGVVLATSPTLSAPTVSGTLAGASETLSGTLSVTGTQTLTGATTMKGNVTMQNGANASQTLAIQPGTSADQTGAVQFNNYSGTAKWQIQKDANNYLRVTDATNSLDRVILPANANTTINAGAGANAVVINNTSGSGAGGFIVYEGGSNYATAALQVSGSGNTTATGYLQGKFMMGTGTMGVAAGAAAGSSPTIACAANHTCDGVSGTVTLTTGTSPTTGTLATLSFPNTHTNQANCMVTTLSATGMITSDTWTESTTAITIAANTALTASTAYTIKYWCGGY